MLIYAPSDQKEDLFHPHLRNGQPGDKHSNKLVTSRLNGYEARLTPVASDQGPCLPPVHYGFRSFDRQWIIPDNRLINQPNPRLWDMHSERQLYLTSSFDVSPSGGPGLTFTALIPDLNYYNGRGGRVFPLWQDHKGSDSNIPPILLATLGQRYQKLVSPEALIAYVAAIAAHPAFTMRFRSDFINPGVRIPITADSEIFAAVADLGRTVIWLHTFGERFTDPDRGRPAQPPRLQPEHRPHIPTAGAISPDPTAMPEVIAYDATAGRLLLGQGYIEGVTSQIWNYEVSGMQVLLQWFSYRKANRERPIIGNRRPPSKLGKIQPDHWLAEYTTELINLLNVIGRLVELEPLQAELLEQVCSGSMISVDELQKAGTLNVSTNKTRRIRGVDSQSQPSLLD
jgi:hypothetical protein